MLAFLAYCGRTEVLLLISDDVDRPLHCRLPDASHASFLYAVKLGCPPSLYPSSPIA